VAYIRDHALANSDHHGERSFIVFVAIHIGPKAKVRISFMKRTFLVIVMMLLMSASANAIVLYNSSDHKQIALTFDDGPSLKYTPMVLDILKKEGIKATFFVIGRKIEKGPEILERIAKEGHDIGNHTYYHSRVSLLSKEHLGEELDLTSDLVERLTGKEVVFFRPPHGDFSKSGKKFVERAGYVFVLWSVNADDFFHIGWGMRSANSITRRVLSGVKGGDVILAHDDSQQLVDALPVIIESLKSKGYKFVTLSQMEDMLQVNLHRERRSSTISL
jgi:peptidoglycan-N-acetylglucosamine deacetylase